METKCSCGNTTDFIDKKTWMECEVCGDKVFFALKESNTNITEQTEMTKDINTKIHPASKYRYDPKIHFRDAIKQKQGIHNKKIPPKVYTCLEDNFKKYGIYDEEGKTFHDKYKNITKKQILEFLKETKNTEYSEDINHFYCYYTGKKCMDITSLEDILLEDFDIANSQFELLDDDVKEGRKNFLESDFILYQFLWRREIKGISKEDFEFPKTREILLKHERIYSKICEIIGWKWKKISG
jgi:DNA-directed RNA polymerase subunit RPC12/RpoP